MLLTKLHIPQAGKKTVNRTNLFTKLNEGLNRKLILISASAGFGKTTLISDWINQHKIPTAWFSLDKGDNDPVEFLSYVISAIQSINKEFGQSALKLLKSPNEPKPESITGLLINDIIKINKDFLLVLDDFHLINNNEIFKIVRYLLEHIPDNIHIVILTRSDPNLPVAKLRSKYQLVELRSSDLSFSANDISVLFNKKFKFKLSIEDINSLETKTEGWIAGLQLTALSMSGRKDISEFISELKGDNRYIMDYLIEEVLKIQTDDIKEFLLQTSILEQISGPLCNAVLNRNDSQLILEKLEKNNMFVFPLDAERHWYRYHHLFADLLKQRLLLKDKTVIKELHNKACAWFEQNKMYELAIEHALEINNYEKSIQLLGEIVEKMWKNGLHSAVLKYGNLLPDEFIKKNPDFCLYYSWILITSGQIQKAEPFLTSAEKTTKKIIDDKNSSEEDVQYNKKLLGKISVAFAYMNSYEVRSEKIFDYCKTAMKNLSDDDPLWFSWAWFSYGIAYFSIGEIHKSIEAYENALEYAKKSGNIYLISSVAIRLAENEQQLGHYKSSYKICSDLLTFMQESGYGQLTKAEWSFSGLYTLMAAAQFFWADLDNAYENIKIAYDLSKKSGDLMSKTFVLLNYSNLLHWRGDIKESEKKLNELEEIIKRNTFPPFLIFAYVAWKGYRLIELKQFDRASDILKEYCVEPGKEINHANEMAYMMYARLLLEQDKTDEAELLLSEIHNIASTGKRIERLIELDIMYAVMHEKRGNHEKAVAYFIEAMELAADENLLMYFVFNNNHFKDLLKKAYIIQATKKTKIPANFIKKLKLAIERYDKFKTIHAESELSIRELDALKLIAENLTNQEIADRLFISLNTVKTHLKNIYLKLEVDNRTKAVMKAKELRLI